jgi:hypothetical protein
VCTLDVPIPYNIPMMKAVIPGVEEIRRKMEGLLAW